MSLWMLLSVPALAQSTEDEEQAKALYVRGEEAYAEEERRRHEGVQRGGGGEGGGWGGHRDGGG